MRAVVDTNVLVSGLLHAGSVPAAVLRAVEARQLMPVVCDAVMAEYRTVLPRPRLRLPGAEVQQVVRLMERLAIWVDVPAYDGHPQLPDPQDWPFIACAMAADCPVITGNLKHFPKALGVKVMTPRDWVQQPRA